MKTISLVTPCYNEEANVEELYRQVAAVMARYPQYQYEHIFIDNASKDQTVAILKRMAAADLRVKVIINARNFGHIRSPYYGLMQAYGDAVILIVADLQDPTEMIPSFLAKWEEGYKIAIGVKTQAEESWLMFRLRKLGYYWISRLADVQLIKNYTGFGLYDKEVIDILRTYEDPYPYFRGMISDIGLEIAQIPYTQPTRKRGVSSNNLYSLYDIGMLGVTSYSKIPLRLAVMAGFFLGICSLVLAMVFLVLKLLYWEQFSMGTAPLLIGLFFFSAVQLGFIGLLGEYIASINTRVMKRPLVIEKERVNFETSTARRY